MASDTAVVFGLVVAAVLTSLVGVWVITETGVEPKQSADGKHLVRPGRVMCALAVACVLVPPVMLTWPIGDTPVVVVVTGTAVLEVLAIAFLSWVLRTRVEFDENVIRARYLQSGWICVEWAHVVRVRFRLWSTSIVLEDDESRRVSAQLFMRGMSPLLSAIERLVPDSAEGKKWALEQARRQLQR